MHATNFALKRAHLLSLAMLRSKLKPYARLELTPARADLLNLIRTTQPYHTHQRDIAVRLGVTRSTISRMLIQLEAMGLILRRRRQDDRRGNLVWLSPEGRNRLRILVRRIMDAGVVDAALRQIFRAAPGECRRPHATLLTDLRRFTARLGDTATPPYVARIIGERPPLWPWPNDTDWEG
jgi:DNA-binding MarR family transcriptional regulator